MPLLPMPVVDELILQLNLGQVLLALFVLSVVGVLPKNSQRLVALNTLAFGVLFLVTPTSLAPSHYKYLGLALLVVGPMLYTTSNQ
ncbi:hypothetical protein [Halospeciosus flavus]|uniref:DUF8006 domain-containing protein n=1 Tax=Halospeciosus flavus TaxID=3032283 RepID=A0ABD5Z8B3_9EURY|nr:hypothetical protein [Halospeciosus flavus]